MKLILKGFMNSNFGLVLHKNSFSPHLEKTLNHAYSKYSNSNSYTDAYSDVQSAYVIVSTYWHLSYLIGQNRQLNRLVTRLLRARTDILADMIAPPRTAQGSLRYRAYHLLITVDTQCWSQALSRSTGKVFKLRTRSQRLEDKHGFHIYHCVTAPSFDFLLFAPMELRNEWAI